MSTFHDTTRRKSLKLQGLLNPAVDAVADERFEDDGFFDPADLVQVRYEMLRSVRVGERSATTAASAFGVSRATYYQTVASYDREGIVGLIPRKRGPQGPHKLKAEVLDFVIVELQAQPGIGVDALVARISEQFGISVHPRSIERALTQRSKKKPGRRG